MLSDGFHEQRPNAISDICPTRLPTSRIAVSGQLTYFSVYEFLASTPDSAVQAETANYSSNNHRLFVRFRWA
jgi:hypothetical protein